MIRQFVVVLLGFATAAFAQQSVLEVITLKYRAADQVLPVVEPLVRGQGTVTGAGNRLILRTTPANLEEVRRVLAAIDTPPRRLKITVMQDVDRATRDRLLELSGRVSSGEVAVEVPGTPGRSGASATAREGDDLLRGRALERELRESDRNTQFIQALDGTPAFIAVRQSQPLVERVWVQTPHGVRVVEDLGSRDLATGFYVVARVSGERVTLEINPRRDEPGPRGSLRTQEAYTTVSGRLGEWLDLGGVSRARSAEASGIASSRAGGATEERTILLRVEEEK
jgi:hypothetical protein